jgi:hypothetical protein
VPPARPRRMMSARCSGPADRLATGGVGKRGEETILATRLGMP